MCTIDRRMAATLLLSYGWAARATQRPSSKMNERRAGGARRERRTIGRDRAPLSSCRGRVDAFPGGAESLEWLVCCASGPTLAGGEVVRNLPTQILAARPSYTSTPFSRQATQQEQQRNSDFGFNQLVSLLLGVRINVPALFFSHRIIKMPPNASSPSAPPLSTSTLLVRTVKTGVPP